MIAFLLSAALTALGQEPGPSPLEPLQPLAGQEADAKAPACTADRRWCAVIDTDETREHRVLRLYDGLPDGREPVASHPIEGPTESYWKLSGVLRKEGEEAILVGADMDLTAMYSGGGGMSTYRTLVRFAPGETPQDVLTVPVGGSLTIRACFGEEDTAQRAGACHDEYDFTGALQAEGDAFPPTLVYSTTATSFPGPVSRNEDSLAKPPLKPKDLVKVVDEACTIRRVFVFDPATKAYVPDAPLPDCSAYTVP